jgi:hypothetical protein
MDGDPRADARRALERLREGSLCGSCRQDYDTMIDALDRGGEFEELMRRYVEVGERHPHASHLPERAAQITAARDEVARRLAAAPAPGQPQERGGVLRYRPGEVRGVVRSWRETLGGLLPRPLGLLPGRDTRRRRE